MAEYIKREDAVMKIAGNILQFDTEADAEYAETLLYYVPEADAVEVVRCKDCRYWSALDKGSWVCKGRTDGECEMLAVHHNSEIPCTEQDHFCSYGKRKDGADG